ncbi:MAG TPA: hypothetical protein VK815_12135 [Candidatus Acidoferrales bacterium]|jgi:hypothetical protein|nr:hypothetical protein [Candidatus Acidoferrales bacterium]
MSEQGKKPPYKLDVPFWVVSIIIIGILVAIAGKIPRTIGGSHTSPANNCINNLRQIDAAANQFALEHNKTNGEAIKFPDDLTPYIKLTSEDKIPPCPSGGIYHISKFGEAPTCSLSNTVSPPHVLP